MSEWKNVEFETCFSLEKHIPVDELLLGRNARLDEMIASTLRSQTET